MTERNTIQDELKDLNSDLSADNSQAPFDVPAGYFDGLAATILAKAKAQDNSAALELAELSPLLASLSKVMPYNLPDGYFDENISALHFVFAEEGSAVLNSIGKTLPYEVPAGYFENLPQLVLAKLNQPKGKVVPLFSRTWMRAAVAAVVGGILFISGYQYFNKPTDAQTANQQTADSGKNGVAKSDPSVFSNLKTVSEQELDEFIQTVPLQPATTEKGASASASKGEIQKLLKGVSEKELDNFLEQLPNVDDDLAIIN